MAGYPGNRYPSKGGRSSMPGEVVSRRGFSVPAVSYAPTEGEALQVKRRPEKVTPVAKKGIIERGRDFVRGTGLKTTVDIHNKGKKRGDRL